jgi:hypothetical protein
LTRRTFFHAAGAFAALSGCTVAGAQQGKLPTAALWPEAAAPAVFPLSLKPGAGYPIDAAGNPFLLIGDAAWSLIAQLSREDAELYLEDRRARGFNAILVSLVEHKYASHPPANFYGEQPFLTPGDFSTPNERYFQHADWVLERAAAKNLLVLLTPDYLGYDGQDEGWWKELAKLGQQKLLDWGRFAGKRYARFNNILWVNGGDYNAPDKSIVRAVAQGLRETNPAALQTAHNGPDTSALDYWSAEDWLSINTVYTYGPVYDLMRRQVAQGAHMPAILVESTYEDEHGSTEEKLRRQAYESVLAGGFGHVFGNNPMWHFDGPGLFKEKQTWKQALGSRGAQSMTHLRNIMHRAKWWTLSPDNAVKPAGGGADNRPVASRGADGSVVMAYLPKGGSVEIDLSRLSSPSVRLSWYDPSNGALNEIPPASGGQSKRVLPSPPRNAAGFEDWVLLVESAG